MSITGRGRHNDHDKRLTAAGRSTTEMTEDTNSPNSPLDLLVSAFSEHDCLCCGPFEGDFGSPDDRILKDKMVTARKGGECHLCGQQIQPKERIRSMAAVFDGELMSYRWCNACCAAMAKSLYDDGEAWEERAALRR